MVTQNNYKYLKAPTIEQVESVVKAAGVSEAQFERFHLFDGLISHVRMGLRSIPSKYWHIFFDTKMATAKPTIKYAHEAPVKRTKIKPTGTLSNLLS